MSKYSGSHSSLFFKRKNKGFTLIELMLVLGVIVVLTTLAFSDQIRDRDLALAKATGKQIQTVGQALNQYISIYHDPLTNLVSAPLPTDDGGPRNCDKTTPISATASGSCSININTLINAGLLPPGYKGITPFQSAYVIKIVRRPTGVTANFSLDGLVTTALPWVTGANPRYDLLGAAIQEAGADAGMTSTSATEMDGYNGMWKDVSGDFSAINNLGLLGYRAGYQANSYSAFLRIDGTSKMTGPLDMGNQTIENAQDVIASGGIQAQSMYVNGGVIQLGSTNRIFANSAAGVNQTVFSQNDGVLFVRNDNPNLPADIAAVNNIRAKGDITTTGSIITSKQLQVTSASGTPPPPGASLSLYNQGDMANTGIIYADKMQIAADPTSEPGVNPTTDATARLTVFGSGFVSKDWSVYGHLFSNSFQAASGNVLAFDGTSSVLMNNDLYLQGSLFLNKVVNTTTNPVCGVDAAGVSEKGSIARTPSGGLVICDDSGNWKSTAILTTVVKYGSQTSDVSTPSDVYCGAGSYATGGGYRRTAIYNAAATYLPTSPIDSTPIPPTASGANGGFQVTGGSLDVGFTPFVVCSVISD